MALAAYERALAAEQAIGDRAGEARSLGYIGEVHQARGESSKAIEFERRAVALANSLARGLGAEEGAGARSTISFAFDAGAKAALSLKDASQLAWFLESGRAGALAEGLSARKTLWSVAVPEGLRAQEAAAHASETAATTSLLAALRGRDLAAIRARRAEVEAAQERVSIVIARIQREAKAGSAIVCPDAATLDEIRATLADGDVLVLLGLPDRIAVALVITKADARIVDLGRSAPIIAAAEAFVPGDPTLDATSARATLERILVEPLGLPAGTRRALLSPVGALSYIPFSALMPGVTVSYVASGTTYALLRADAGERGTGVLALGDPAYETNVDERALALSRGALGRLSRLPATREEAKLVGTTTLLGGEATEAALRATLPRERRWHAVHFACHGLIDSERPALSSLALTGGGDDDGFLTVLEVFRSKIPSDLVVLSACETARGKVVKGEGIVGLTRAFMFAGAPRVICSLWKVDDDATRALMVKFYELWNPKEGVKPMGTAAALKAAQEYVSSYETEVPDAEATQRAGRPVTKRVRPWEHPYYWAAWVLWGLPD